MKACPHSTNSDAEFAGSVPLGKTDSGSRESSPTAGDPTARHTRRLVARTDRWRYPSWSEVCRAADRARSRRDRLHPPAVRIRVEAQPRGRRCRLLWRYGPGWLFSLAAHAAVLLTLAWYAVNAGPQPDGDARYVIRVDPAPDPPGPPLVALEVAIASPAAVQANGPISAPLSAPTLQQDPGALPPAISLALFAESRSGPVGEALALFGRDGHGRAARGSGAEGSEFFGVRAAGSRFVFVVDCSRSMGEGNKWQDASRELLAAIDRLEPEQSFYVIFFAGEIQPMFTADRPEADLLPATAENVQRFREWLATVQLGPYTRPARAVQLGLELAPDALYLLSDGVFEDPTAAILRQKNQVRRDARRVPRVIVHTIGLHSREGRAVLERIAAENGGRHVFIPAGQLAQAERQQR